MALPIQKLREIVFHLLFSHDHAASSDDMVPFLMDHHQVTKKSLYTAQDIVSKVASHQPTIDALIQAHSPDYEFDRIPRVERNVLRLAIFEMLYSGDIPPKVAISEAIRLARKFATAESAQFVNAILDAIYKKTAAV